MSITLACVQLLTDSCRDFFSNYPVTVNCKWKLVGGKEWRDDSNDIVVLKIQCILTQVTNLNFGSDFRNL